MKNLKEKSELASRIRENNIQYSKYKYLIHSLFENNDIIVTGERILTQLTIIDSYYSTNMSLRYYGIEEIKDSILNISSKQYDLKRKFTEYAKDPENHKDITDLFHANYGYKKVDINPVDLYQ